MTVVKKAANNAETVLAQVIDATATSFDVEDGAIFPTDAFLVTVNEEIMFIGTRSGNTFTNITRGVEGTVKAAHDAGDAVENRFTAGAHIQLIDAIDGVTGDLAAHKAESANKHIAESGTNLNGSYVKFDDGTMVCHISKTLTSEELGDLTSRTEGGSTFYTTTKRLTYPATFISKPSASAGGRFFGDSGGARVWSGSIETNADNITNVELQIVAMRDVYSISNLSIIAVGRWK